MNQVYYGSNYRYYSPDPPSSGYEGKPTEIVGFRLAYDGDCRVFVGCVNACKAPARRFGVFQERGDWKAHGVGFRLTLDKEGTWPTK